MMERAKNSIKKIWIKASKKPAALLALIIIIAAGFYFFNEWLTVKSAENRWEELKEPYVLIEKNYEIYEVSYPGGTYQYFIYDNKHNVLESHYIYEKTLNITMTHGLMRYNPYSYDNHFVYTYYDIEKGLVSLPFYFVNIIKESNTMVVYTEIHDNGHLVVQDIFDKTKYYRVFNIDLSDVADPVTRADFINGGRQLSITYKAGKDEHEVTETLDLYDEGDEP